MHARKVKPQLTSACLLAVHDRYRQQVTRQTPCGNKWPSLPPLLSWPPVDELEESPCMPSPPSWFSELCNKVFLSIINVQAHAIKFVVRNEPTAAVGPVGRQVLAERRHLDGMCHRGRHGEHMVSFTQYAEVLHSKTGQ